jgi:hypothetical protein
MSKHALQITLLSDATFARGDSYGTGVDIEIDHDPTTGLPQISGRRLKGLLVEECANLLAAPVPQSVRAAARALFGVPGSSIDSDGTLHIGPARLPAPFCEAIALEQAVQAERNARAERSDATDGSDAVYSAPSPIDVLEALTVIRRQTSVTEAGVPEDGSLRSARAALRGLVFEATATLRDGADADQRALLSACALGLRRGGVGRNRGRGRLDVRLITDGSEDRGAFERFVELMRG